jgi:hypothetical protein
MITLNTNKGLVKVEGWDEIESRPGFVKNLNPAEHTLDSIIGRYIFKEKISCGLSNCHRPHAKGYIVTTKDGHETNIGKDCGKTYFGVDFETLTKKFDRYITESENRERLWSFSFQLEELESKIAELRNGKKGADWIHKHISPLVSQSGDCPVEVVRRIASMLKARTTILTIARVATESEIQNMEAAQNRTLPRPQYVDEPIAEIDGVQVLYPENDLRKLLILDLQENIKVFKEKDIDTLTFEELQHWAKWIVSVENTIERARVAISLGNSLLTQANLEPFIKILATEKDKALFRAYIKKLNQPA